MEFCCVLGLNLSGKKLRNTHCMESELEVHRGSKPTLTRWCSMTVATAGEIDIDGVKIQWQEVTGWNGDHPGMQVAKAWEVLREISQNDSRAEYILVLSRTDQAKNVRTHRAVKGCSVKSGSVGPIGFHSEIPRGQKRINLYASVR